MSTNNKAYTKWQEKLLKKFLKVYSRVNVWVYKKSGGKYGAKFQGKAPVLLLTMRGRKSGELKTTPLIHIANGDDVVLVASQGGMSKDPIWYLNLQADPSVEITVGNKSRKMVARNATDQEKQELWGLICSVHPDFQAYQDRTERNIPVMICSPV
jgi:deazaflavin-dependent oxidoreductase (nitroreductase family)